MVFVDRKAKYPGRWTMIKSDGTSEVVTLVRNDEPEVEGTPMNAETLNTLSDVAGADIARQQAEAAQKAAAGSATEAAGSASAAEESKTAAATSESNAAKHEEAAKKAAEEAGAKAGTDKTLSIENAPADAKATGDALAGKVDKDVILDEDGNVIFYSKAAVDELLAGKLDLTGGTMIGKILINAIGSDVIKISGSNENADEEIEFERTDTGAVLACGIGAGGDNMGLFDRKNGKWAFHVKSTTGDIYIGGTKCIGFVVASGDNYVRFGDGTQICWGTLQSTVTFPVAFATTSYGVGVSGTATLGIPSFPYVVKKTVTNMEISNNNGDSYIAIGRWK